MKKQLLILTILLLISTSAYSANITNYISPFGNDLTAERNNPAKPWKSPKTAYDNIAGETTTAFDTLYFMEGEYYFFAAEGLSETTPIARNGLAITGAGKWLTKFIGTGTNRLISLVFTPVNKGTPALSTQYGQQISNIGFYNATAAIYKAAGNTNNTLGFWNNYFDSTTTTSLQMPHSSYVLSFLVYNNIFNNSPISIQNGVQYSLPSYSATDGYNLFYNNTVIRKLFPTTTLRTDIYYANDNIFYGDTTNISYSTWKWKNNRFYSLSQINGGSVAENINNTFDTTSPFIENSGFTLKPTDIAVNAGTNNKTIGATEVGITTQFDTWLIYDSNFNETVPLTQSKVMYLSQNRMRFYDTAVINSPITIITQIAERHSNPASYWIKFPVQFKSEWYNDSGYRTRLSNNKTDTVSTIILIGSDDYNDIYNLNLSNCYVDYNYINGSVITDTTMRRKKYLRAILKFHFDV